MKPKINPRLLLVSSVITLSATGSQAAELVANGDFSANAPSFTVFPGYVGGSNPGAPTGWLTSGDGTGLNGSLTGGAGSAFAPAIDVGSFAFLQGSDRSVTQAINTVATADYQFTFDAAARNGTGPSGVSVQADSTQPASLVLDGTGTNYGWLNQSAFQHYTFGFTATGAQTIRFNSSGDGVINDHTTDITNVSVTDLASAKYAVGNATVFFTSSGTSANGFALTGNNQTIYQRSGAAAYTGNITTDGSGGALEIKSYGWQAGTATLTFSGSTIALGAKSLQTNGQNGGNVDVIDHANYARITLNDVTFSTDADVVLGNKALHFIGSTQATIGGQIRSINAWNDFTLGGIAAVVVTGGVDLKNVASHLELNGGTLTTPFIWGNTTFSGATRTILNGTRIIASADSADFLKMSNDFDNAAHGAAAVIGNGGAVFDTDGHNVTIANVLADLSGNTGTLTKLGTGTLALTSANAFTGTTTVTKGILRLGNGATNTSLADTAGVVIGTDATAVLNLNYTGTDAIAALTINGVVKAPGVYGSSDPSGRITGTGTLTVGTISPYTTWANSFLPGNNVSNPAGDNDNDGLTNQQEFAFGLSPISGSSVNPILVQVNKTTGQFSYQRRASSGLTYKVLTSTTLAVGSWTQDITASQVPGATDGNGNQTVVVTLTGAPLSATKLFVRVSAD